MNEARGAIRGAEFGADLISQASHEGAAFTEAEHYALSVLMRAVRGILSTAAIRAGRRNGGEA